MQLVNLTSRAWALPLLAALHNGVPGRQAALVSACGAGRTAFQHSMSHVIDLGLVARNTGHGHPLRPEFVLTETGKSAAAFAARTIDLSGAQTRLIQRVWTLPVIAQTTEPTPFSAIRSSLPSITDRALSMSLQSLEAADWVTREVDVAARPPRPHYCATGAGARIGAVLQATFQRSGGGASGSA